MLVIIVTLTMCSCIMNLSINFEEGNIVASVIVTVCIAIESQRVLLRCSISFLHNIILCKYEGIMNITDVQKQYCFRY